MDHQADTTRSDLERMLSDERMEAKALPLPLLKSITDNFSNKNEIGRGGFAVVYKGLLEKETVAVKKLSDMSVTDERRFHGEVECLMKAKHKNIVRFLGYCSDTQGQWVECNGKSGMADVRQRLLCFEYLPNRSLDKYIKDASLEWGKCYQIINGVCQGLHFLHKKNIVHSDLKPANILLDNDMVPKITDFGISRCFDGNQTHIVTENITGSLGYVAQEVFSGKISFKSDIFSLGVIITEILTGNKGYPNVKDVLNRWEQKVKKSHRDQELGQISVCTEVAQSCLEYYPMKRPSAQDIIDILKQKERKEHRIETGVPNEMNSHIMQESLLLTKRQVKREKFIAILRFKRLQNLTNYKWCLSMLRKACKEEIVVELTNLYDHFFITRADSSQAPKGKPNKQQQPAEVVMLDGPTIVTGDVGRCRSGNVVPVPGAREHFRPRLEKTISKHRCRTMFPVSVSRSLRSENLVTMGPTSTTVQVSPGQSLSTSTRTGSVPRRH